jgi:hypothetical protein
LRRPPRSRFLTSAVRPRRPDRRPTGRSTPPTWRRAQRDRSERCGDRCASRHDHRRDRWRASTPPGGLCPARVVRKLPGGVAIHEIPDVSNNFACDLQDAKLRRRPDGG